MFTLQILHASDLEGGVDAIANAPNFAAVVDALEADAAAGGFSSVLLSSGDNYIPGPFYNAAGDSSTFNPLFEGFYNEFFGLVNPDVLAAEDDTNGDGFFDNGEIEAAIRAGTVAFDDVYTTDVNGDGFVDYFEEIDNFEGRVDITIMNILGFDAAAVGNHEFDAGTDAFENIINYDSEEGNSLSGSRYADDSEGPALVPGHVNFLQEVDWPGAQFPYLSANLDFSEDGDVGALFTDEILPAEDFASDLVSAREPLPGSEDQFPAVFETAGDPSDSNDTKGGPATILTVDGEQIGVVGATTQLIAQISSTGNVVDVSSPGTNDMAALAATLQPFVDELTGQGIDKIIIVSHLQQFALEEELASLMSGVDVILAGGSDVISADDQDVLRAGDEAEQPYPLIVEDLDGNPTAVVGVDGEYRYVGRLVVEFDENGNIVPESVDETVSGAFATDEAGTLAATGAATLEEAIAASDPASDVQLLVDAAAGVVNTLDGTIFGESTVYIEGRRAEVRTQETTLGNLTADANIVAAQAVDPDVTVSLKNGGGIRSSIGETDADGNLLPTQTNPVSGKQEGEISQLDIQNSLRFDNGLVTVDLSAADLKIILEHAVAGTAEGATPGQFPQVGGVRFAFDPEGDAQVLGLSPDGTLITLQQGTRIQSVEIDLPDGTSQVIVEGGQVVDDAPESIKVVTLDFLAGDEGDLIGGDGYPYRALGEVTDLAISEQDALAEFLTANFPQDAGTPFSTEETAPELDDRIQNLSVREDSIAPIEPVNVDVPVDPEFESVLATDELDITLVQTFQGAFESENEDGPEGATEVVAFAAGTLFTTNGALGLIETFDLESGARGPTIDLEAIVETVDDLAGDAFNPVFDSVQSVDATADYIVAAIDLAANEDGTANRGAIVVVETPDFLGDDDDDSFGFEFIEVGFLPDSVKISPDGRTLVVANEGEFNSESDIAAEVPGGFTIVDLDSLEIGQGTGAGNVLTVDFSDVDGLAAEDAGLRINDDTPLGLDLESEFVTFTPDGSTALISLQENNGFAILSDIDPDALGTPEGVPTISFLSAGTLDHSLPENAFDATDNEIIDIEPRDTLGLRMPDAITTVEIGGTVYLLGANEGDGRGDAFDDGEPVLLGDEARVSELAELGLLDETAYPTTITATDLPMEEAQEVADTPVPDTAATGSFTATLDEVAGTVTVMGSFSDLSSPLFDVGGEDGFGNPESAIHVHLGAAGENGPILANTTVTAATDGLSGTFEQTFEVTDEQAEIFRNDGYYINLHTENFNAGELRGQIDLPEVATVDAQGLGRLIVSTIDGDTDGDGDIDILHSYGSRSFTIWDLEGNVVFDSGSEFERFIAENFPERFNDDDGELGQNRSDAKGPEPEAIAVGVVDDRTYAFVGAERDSGVFVYNITDPENAILVDYLDGFATDNISPETIAFISADESATGNAQIAVAYEISGTTAVYDLVLDSVVTTVEDFYTVALGRMFDTAGLNFWSDALELASDEFLAEAFDLSIEFNGLIDGLSDAEGIDFVYQNGLGRDATAEEQAQFQPIVAEDGYDQVFLEVIDQLV